MEAALRVISHLGIMREQVKSVDVKSRADARKLAPFVDPSKKLVHWVDWSKVKESGKKTRPYFRHYPLSRPQQPLSEKLQEEVALRDHLAKDTVHNDVRDLFAKVIQEHLNQRKALPWGYKDERVSDFSFSGNLLSEVVEVRTEHSIQSPFGNKFRLDIALLGAPIRKTPILLGAIELERSHEFEFLKCCLCKSLGVPLLSVDITDVTAGVTQDWCRERLLETTATSKDGLRRNYIYLHNMLYPVYISVPSDLNILREHHQFVIFVGDGKTETLKKWCCTSRMRLTLNW